MTTYFQRLDEIQKKYEINFELGCFFDSGWWFKIGDPLNGYKYTDDGYENLRQCIDELLRQLKILYPNITKP